MTTNVTKSKILPSVSEIQIPVISREVADAIEWARRIDGAVSVITERVLFTETYNGERTRLLRSIPFDTLLAALVNGYGVEKSPEELAELKRQETYERLRLTYDEKRKGAELYSHCFTESAAEYKGFADGIRFAVRTLKLDIPGVSE